MKSFFPWRLFWKFLLTLVVLMNILLFTAFAVTSMLTKINLEISDVLVFFGIYFIFSGLAAAAFSYRFSSPLKRVILKALRIANKKQVSEAPSMDDVLVDEPGEYFELEMALDKIRRKMKRRRQLLAQEREETQALMSTLEDAVLSVGLDFKVKFYNSRFGTLFLKRAHSESLRSGEPVPLTTIFREPELLELFNNTVAKGEPHSACLRMNSVMDGRDRYYSVKVSPLRQEKTGGFYGAMALFHDVTEVRQSEKVRMEFVENASHELRTPLTSMKGFVDTAKDDVKAGKFDQLGYFLNIISKSADRMSELVNDMLTLSTLESGNSLRKENIKTAEITKELVEQMSALATEKNLNIEVSCDVPTFQADRGKVEQILQNLLGNAIKYIPAGGRIQIRWNEDDEFVFLHVVDNGPGIADLHLNRLFERFYRVDKGRSRDVGGTGLGLSIVKHIMQNHGGQVSVKSEVGRGSEFICSFPKAP